MKLRILSRNYLQRTSTNIFTFGYGVSKTSVDVFGTIGGDEYFVTKSKEVFKRLPSTYQKDAFISIGHVSDFKIDYL